METITLCLIICFLILAWCVRPDAALLVQSLFLWNLTTDKEEVGLIRILRIFACWVALAFAALYITVYAHDMSVWSDRLGAPAQFGLFAVLLAAYAILREAFSAVIGWITDDRSFGHLLKRVTRDGITLIIFTSLPFFLVGSVCFPHIAHTTSILLIITAFSGYFFYISRLARIFISSGYSLFFWILYLCSLEWIPLGLFFHFVARIV